MRALCCSRWFWFCCLFFTLSCDAAATDEVWLEYGLINATNATANNAHGSAVAIENTIMVVGLPGFNGTGAAYVYELVIDEFVQQQMLLPDATTTKYGSAVAISGNTIVIGSYPENLVFVYVYNSTSMLYEKQQKLTGTASTGFGTSVAISGDYLVVGSPLASSSTGAINIFKRTGTAWISDGTFAGSAASDLFGTSVAMDGSTMAVGAPGTTSNKGSVNIYTKGSSWAPLDTMTASDGASNHRFGTSVSMYDSRLVVGAPDAFTTGKIYIYTRHYGTTVDEYMTKHLDAASNQDKFGSSVSIMGDTIAVGAPAHTSNQGAVYVFKRSSIDDTWSQVIQLTNNISISTTGKFGSSVSIDDGFVAVGAPLANGTGLTFVYVEDPATQSPSAQPSQAPSSAPTPAPEYACADFYKQCKDNDKRYMMHKFRGLKDPAKVQLGCRTTCVSKYMVNLYRRQLGWQCGSCLDSLNAKGQGNKHPQTS